MALLLKYDEFKIYVAETLEYTQVLQEDLKWIYSFLHKGDTNKNYFKSSKKNILKLVNDVEALDFAHENHQLNLEDYAVLRQIQNLRNYISEKLFATFILNQDFTKCLEYNHACEKIVNYHAEIKELLPKVRKFREYVTKLIGDIDQKAKN